MYTHNDLASDCDAIRKKIESTDITEETFAEIEESLRALIPKENVVYQQILDLVQQANEMCKLHRAIPATINSVYRDLKIKKLEADGVDLSNSYNRNQKYGSYIEHCLSWAGIPLKVELKQSYR